MSCNTAPALIIISIALVQVAPLKMSKSFGVGHLVIQWAIIISWVGSSCSSLSKYCTIAKLDVIMRASAMLEEKMKKGVDYIYIIIIIQILL